MASSSASSAASDVPDSEPDLPEAPPEEEEQDSYVPPEQKDVSEVRKAGDGSEEDDESLQRYKKALLGSAGEDGAEGKPLRVTIVEVAVDHPSVKGGGARRADSEAGPTIKLDLTDHEGAERAGAVPFTVLGGGWRRVSVKFRVEGQIVHGLCLRCAIKGAQSGIVFDRQKMMLGSYAPSDELREYHAPPRQYPSGLLVRGQYLVDCRFVDDYGNEHCAFEYRFAIAGAWGRDHPAIVHTDT